MRARAEVPVSEQLCLPRKFIAACALVMLHERAGHGYDLTKRLKALGESAERTRIYRGLRWLEEAGLIEPAWETSVRVGQARRVYSVTPVGSETLSRAAPALCRQATSGTDLDQYLVRRLTVVHPYETTLELLGTPEAAGGTNLSR